MNALHLLARLPMSEFDVDDQGVTSHHWLWPEKAEIIYGGLASLIVFAVLWKFAGPVISKAMTARTERIQKELDGAATATADAAAEAERIRQAKGDIEAERARILAEADAQAEQLLADGRVRLDAEAADLLAKADADAAALFARSGDELRAEIAQHAGVTAERLVADHLDTATQNDLIEAFIAKVGAAR